MELLDNLAVRPLPSFDGPLLSLGDAFAARFHSWHGVSGQRYVMSVFAADPAALEMNLPMFEACVVVLVVRDGRGRRMLGVRIIERASDRRGALAEASLHDVDEWHVHLLAGDRHERAAVAADLRARLDDGKILLSA